MALRSERRKAIIPTRIMKAIMASGFAVFVKIFFKKVP
jgi:hypothetical protein